MSAERARSIDPKEEKILVAATQAFLEHGYAATSMDQVANRAHASKTTLYTRFPSKEALFTAVIAAKCEASGVRFAPEEFADATIDEALLTIGCRFLDLICSPEAMRVEQVVMGEAPRFPEIASVFEREGPEQVIAAVAGFFTDAAARGLIAVDDSRFAAEQFLGALKNPCLHGMMLTQRPVMTPAERKAYVARAVALFLNGARGGRP